MNPKPPTVPRPERRDPTYLAGRTIGFRIPPELHEALRRHAFERGVKFQQLITDVLTLWVLAATDPHDPLFTGKLALGLPSLPPERYPGYREGLLL